MNSISPNLNLMIKASEKASKILIRDFGEVEKLQVSLKGPNNFVTNADRKVEEIIIQELEKSKKNFSILTEESGFIKNKDKNNFWIIDPIDGTTNFLNGVPHFCISIALQILPRCVFVRMRVYRAGGLPSGSGGPTMCVYRCMCLCVCVCSCLIDSTHARI